jgi:hypothetical protein
LTPREDIFLLFSNLFFHSVCSVVLLEISFSLISFSIVASQVEESKQLGEWVGLCKLDAEGKARKVVGCSCVVIKSWGEESRARSLLLEALEQM